MTAALLAAGVALGLGVLIGRYLLAFLTQRTLGQARAEADRLRADAARTIEQERRTQVERPREEVDRARQALAQGREEAKRAALHVKQRLDQRQEKLNRRIQRVNDREQALQKAAELIESLGQGAKNTQKNADQLRQRAQRLFTEAEQARREVEHQEASVRHEREAIEQMQEAYLRKLEQAAGLSQREAKEHLLEQVLSEVRLEAASHVKAIRDEAKLKANREARKIILTAIQRTAASHAIENTVSVVNIQSDDMKGRIIGREGRNIRAFEAATGIEVIVDDTPEAVLLSGFDPVRREVARLSLIKLLQDGRIHPTRIEEVVQKVSAEIEEEIVEAGERAVIDLRVHGLHPALIRHVGRMRYRTSYGQNVLAHSMETARIASLMAAELGLDTDLALRAGLLHDVGKVVEEKIDQPHALVGMDLCRTYKEHPDVCNAVGAHHDEIEMECLIAPVVQAADAISGARPGARREALENYIKRLRKLEDLAGSFEGVGRVYAIQAGREIRVIVNHELVSDAQAEQLAHDISAKIQHEMQYPGQVKVTVIREVRSVAYAT